MKRVIGSSVPQRKASPLVKLTKTVSCLSLLIGVIASLTLSSNATPDRREHDRIAAVLDAVAATRAAEPDLKGFKDAATIASNAFANRSNDDGDLLAARLYYDRAQAPRILPRPAQLKQRIRNGLSHGFSSDKFGKTYFDQLLANTKARMERDRKFRLAINNSLATSQAIGNRYTGTPTCYIDGWQSPLHWCLSWLHWHFIEFI